MDYKKRFLKYKLKYQNLLQQIGGYDQKVLDLIKENQEFIYGILFNVERNKFSALDDQGYSWDNPIHKKILLTRCSLTTEVLWNLITNFNPQFLDFKRTSLLGLDYMASNNNWFRLLIDLKESKVEKIYILELSNQKGFYGDGHSFIIHKYFIEDQMFFNGTVVI